MKLNFVIAEAALELVPEELRRDRSVVVDAERRGVEPSRILLDRSFHHRAMLRLKDGLKRGRPDLVHVTLLSVTGSPLYMDGMAKAFVHTHGDVVLELKERTRIPKSYFRFRGLIEQALTTRPDTGLLKVYPATLEQLLKNIGSDSIVSALTASQRRSERRAERFLTISYTMSNCAGQVETKAVGQFLWSSSTKGDCGEGGTKGRRRSGNIGEKGLRHKTIVWKIPFQEPSTTEGKNEEGLEVRRVCTTLFLR